MISGGRVDEDGVCFGRGGEEAVASCRVAIPALYEADNAALAVKTCQILRREKMSFYDGMTDDVIRCGLLETVWPGRMERLETRIFVDGAHNPAGVRAFIETVKALPCVTSLSGSWEIRIIRP